MYAVTVTILPVGMSLDAAIDHRTTWAARCGGGECVSKLGALLGEPVDIGGLDDVVSVTTTVILVLVVRNQ